MIPTLAARAPIKSRQACIVAAPFCGLNGPNYVYRSSISSSHSWRKIERSTRRPLLERHYSWSPDSTKCRSLGSKLPAPRSWPAARRLPSLPQPRRVAPSGFGDVTDARENRAQGKRRRAPERVLRPGARRRSRPGDHHGALRPLHRRRPGLQRVRADLDEGQQLRPERRRSVFRPLRLSHYRDPLRLERVEPLLPQLLHAPDPADLPSLLCRPVLALLRPSAISFALSAGAPRIVSPAAVDLAVRSQPVRRAARRMGAALRQPFLVAGRGGAFLPGLARRRRLRLARKPPQDLLRVRVVLADPANRTRAGRPERDLDPGPHSLPPRCALHRRFSRRRQPLGCARPTCARRAPRDAALRRIHPGRLHLVLDDPSVPRRLPPDPRLADRAVLRRLVDRLRERGPSRLARPFLREPRDAFFRKVQLRHLRLSR